MQLHVLVRFGRWRDLITFDDKIYTTRLDASGNVEHIVAIATVHYARGLAYAAMGDVAVAQEQYRLFREAVAREKMDERQLFNNFCRQIFAVADAMLAGEILYREQAYAEAFAKLRLAVVLNDGAPDRVMDREMAPQGLV